MELPTGAYNGTAAGLELPRALANGSAALSERQQYAIGLFLSCLYAVFLFPIGFVGNLLILAVNFRFREKMTIPDLYFINLAAADLILVHLVINPREPTKGAEGNQADYGLHRPPSYLLKLYT